MAQGKGAIESSDDQPAVWMAARQSQWHQPTLNVPCKGRMLHMGTFNGLYNNREVLENPVIEPKVSSLRIASSEKMTPKSGSSPTYKTGETDVNLVLNAQDKHYSQGNRQVSISACYRVQQVRFVALESSAGTSFGFLNEDSAARNCNLAGFARPLSVAQQEINIPGFSEMKVSWMALGLWQVRGEARCLFGEHCEEGGGGETRKCFRACRSRSQRHLLLPPRGFVT